MSGHALFVLSLTRLGAPGGRLNCVSVGFVSPPQLHRHCMLCNSILILLVGKEDPSPQGLVPLEDDCGAAPLSVKDSAPATNSHEMKTQTLCPKNISKIVIS